MDRELNAPTSKWLLWGSYVISALPVLLLLFSASGKFFKPDGMEANITPLGWRMDQMVNLGIVELACTALYLIPRTSIFGAILLTAYLGGATAAHVRIGDPFFIPIVVGALLWLGLYLREPRLRALVPIRN